MSLISGLIKQTVDYVYSVAKDRYGDTTRTVVYKNVKCKWSESSRRSIIVGSEKLTYNCIMYLLPSYPVQLDYEVIKDGVSYTVVKIDKKYNLGGHLDFYKVYVK